MGFFRQVAALLEVQLRSVPQRLGSTMVIVVGLAGVVAVLTALQAMSLGMLATLSATGEPDRAIVLRDGTFTELSSYITRDEFVVVEQDQALARNADGKPLASPELVVIAEQRLKARDTSANVTLRGVGEIGFDIRPELQISEGRRYSSGLQELIVGRKAAQQFAGLGIGEQVRIRGSTWTVVGHFTTGGDAHESEIWADLGTAQSAFNRTAYSSVLVRLADPEAFDAFRERLKADPRLSADAKPEREFYSAQSEQFRQSIGWLVAVVGVIMGLGAVFAALNTMYSAVDSRRTEIATLRAIGFSGGVIVTATLLEAMLLAAAGGLAGGALTWLVFNGYSVSTLGAGFTQVAFEFLVTPGLIGSGLVLSLLIGLVGGLAPAVRAARVPVIKALRAA